MKVNRVIRYGFTGILLGYLMSLILTQWVWLEMRITVGLIIPAGFIIGVICGVLIKRDSKLWGLFIPEMLLAVCLVVLYGRDLEALAVIPAILLREGIFMPEIGLNVINIILLAVFIGGNIFWLCNQAHSPLKNNIMSNPEKQH